MNYPDDQSRLSVVRARLTDATDKTLTEPYKTLSDLMGYLYNRYGSLTSIMTAQLDKLEEIPDASNPDILEKNLVQVGSAITLSTSDEHKLLWSTTRVAHIMNNCLDAPTLRMFWTDFETMKTGTLKLHNGTLDPSTPVAIDQWEVLFDKNYTQTRLDFLSGFCQTQIAILRNMRISQSKGNKKNSSNKPVSNVLGPESRTCPLCQGAHKSSFKNVGPTSVCA